jgi:hypothetical protein
MHYTQNDQGQSPADQAATAGFAAVQPSSGLDPDSSFLFDEFFSNFQMNNTTTTPTTPQPPPDTHIMASLSVFTDLDASFSDDTSFDFSTLPPIPGPVFSPGYSYGCLSNNHMPASPILPPGDFTALSSTYNLESPSALTQPSLDDSTALSNTNSKLPSTLTLAGRSGSTAAKNVSAATTTWTSEDSDAPLCRTTCRHVPSMHEQVLNSIGSSCARICMPAAASDGKENNKRKANSTGTVQSSK